MAVAFVQQRIINTPAGAIGSNDSADPNTLAAADITARIQEVLRYSDSSKRSEGFALVLIAKDAADGGGIHLPNVTFDFTVWVRDSKQITELYSTTPKTAVASRRITLYRDADSPPDPEIVVQLSAKAGAQAASVLSVIIRLTPL